MKKYAILIAILACLTSVHALTELAGWPVAITDSGLILQSATIADVDGDGVAEIAIATRGISHTSPFITGKVYLYTVNGNMISGWPRDADSYPGQGNPKDIIATPPSIGNLTGGGIIVVSTSTDFDSGAEDKGLINAWSYDGTALWSESSTTGVAARSPTTLVDLDGDGNLEIIVPSKDGKLYAFDASGGVQWSSSMGGINVAGAAASGDLNGDNKPDLVVTASDGNIHAFTDSGISLWNTSVGAEGKESPVIGDIDFDGDLEVVVSTQNGMYLLEDDGSIAWQISEPKKAFSLALGDLDRDGYLEVVAGSTYSNKLYVINANGSLRWDHPVSSNEQTSASPIIMDLDNDGYPEILFVTSTTNSSDGKLYALSINNEIVWSQEIGNSNAGTTVPPPPSGGDLQGDGDLEVVVPTIGGTVHLYDIPSISGGYLPWPMFHHDAKHTGLYDIPVFKMTSPQDGSTHNENDNIAFNAEGYTVSGTTPSFGWDSSINGSLSSGSSFTKSCLSVGNHNITVTASDAEGKAASIYRTISITNVPPVAAINNPSKTVFQENETVSISGEGTDCSIKTYEWSSNVSGLLSTSSSFTNSTMTGTHLVTFKVWDDNAATATDNVVIRINAHPLANIIVPANESFFNQSEVISFSGTGSDSDGSISKYEWDFDGDGTYDWTSTTSGNITYNYSTGGNYTARFNVTDNDGATNTMDVDIKINYLPNVWINSPTEVEFKVGKQVSFVGVAQDTDGAIDSVTWNSNIDGELSTATSFNISNLSLGNHVISFSATDNDGGTTSANKSLLIKPLEAPDANISSPHESAVFPYGSSIFFNGSGEDIDGEIDSFNWTSSIDGFLSNSSSFSKSLSSGSHTITLTVTDEDGLMGSKPINIFVSSPPSTGDSSNNIVTITVESKQETELVLRATSNTNFYVTHPDSTAALAGPLMALGIFPLPPEKALETSKLVKKNIGTLEGDLYSIVSEQVLKKYKKSQKAVIARGDLEVDSLASVAFARVLGIPILLVEPGRIPLPTGKAIEKLEVESAIVVGGPVAVSEEVSQALPVSERIWGQNREETAVKIAEALMSQQNVNTVVVTDGKNPEPLAVLAAVQNSAPILYVSDSDIPPATEAFLKKHKLNIVTVGVSSDMDNKLRGLY